MKVILNSCIAVICCMFSAWSEPVPQTPEQVNAMMSRRAELVMQKKNIEIELAQAWLDAAQTSDEVAAARKKYRDLQKELECAKQEIKKAVLALPANQEKQRTMQTIAQELDAINKKVDELRRTMGTSHRVTTETVPVAPAAQ